MASEYSVETGTGSYVRADGEVRFMVNGQDAGQVVGFLVKTPEGYSLMRNPEIEHPLWPFTQPIIPAGEGL